jgi:asparagine synthase (glutamine-hydrolysing)
MRFVRSRADADERAASKHVGRSVLFFANHRSYGFRNSHFDNGSHKQPHLVHDSGPKSHQVVARTSIETMTRNQPSTHSVAATTSKLRELFDEAAGRNLADCILLSGGLDTSIVALNARKYSTLTGITVSLGEAPDERFARIISRNLGFGHTIVRIDERDAEIAIQDVVKTMRSFDPMEIRNDVAVMIGLRRAKDLGFRHVLTGDAGDELFAGYSFLFSKEREELEKYLADLWEIMRFASVPLAASQGMDARLPFLDPALQEFSKEIPAELKIHEEQGIVYGKWILRKAYEQILPNEIVWRTKMPIEQGSGTLVLTKYFENKISDDKFGAMRKFYLETEGVRLMDKEHLAYYEVFRSMFGSPRGMGEGSRLCVGCGSCLGERVSYCRTCGAYPAQIFCSSSTTPSM